MLIEPFSTRLYQFDNAFGMSEERNDVLINVLNTIKETLIFLEEVVKGL